MALINCAECGREVSDQAAACPHCGYPLKAAEKGRTGTKAIKKIGPAQKALLLLVTAAVAGALIWNGGQDDPTPPPAVSADGSQIPAARVAEYIQKLGEEKYQTEIDRINRLPRLSVLQLLKEYESNEIAADQQYKGAEIILSGRVAAIAKSLTGAPRLTLRGGGRQKEITVTLKRSQEKQAAGLAKSDQVTLRAVLARSLLGQVKLDDGVFFDESHPLAGHRALAGNP